MLITTPGSDLKKSVFLPPSSAGLRDDNLSLQNMSCLIISSAYHELFDFQNPGILHITTLQLFCKLEMIHSNSLIRTFKIGYSQENFEMHSWMGWQLSKQGSNHHSQAGYSQLAIAKQKAPYNYSSCYISFPRDSFRCKFIYRGRWDEMCNRHTWLTRILYLLHSKVQCLW